MIGSPLLISGGVHVKLMQVLDALTTFGAPGGPASTKETRKKESESDYVIYLRGKLFKEKLN